jgi:hypothetical protein
VNALPNSELVTVAWLRDAVPYLEGRAATSLPANDASWLERGFVTATVVGGTPNNEVGWRLPVMSVDVWAGSPNSGRPQWNAASQLAEQIREAIEDHGTVGRPVVLPPAYRGARVESVEMLTEPRRTPGDVANYAHYQMDVQFRWKALP